MARKAKANGKRNGTTPTPLRPAANKRKASHQPPADPTERIRPYQWKDGQSGNPLGRPKNPIGADIRSFLDEYDTMKSGEQMQRKLRLIRKMFRLSVFDGDMTAARLMMEYGYGKPSQPIEIDDSTLDRWAQAVADKFGVEKDDVMRRYKDSERFRLANAG